MGTRRSAFGDLLAVSLHVVTTILVKGKFHYTQVVPGFVSKITEFGFWGRLPANIVRFQQYSDMI